jgi:hypothetical protein
LFQIIIKPVLIFNFIVSVSDDSSINDVINSCLIGCRKQNIDHYRKKSQENQLEINGGPDELQNEENMVFFINIFKKNNYYNNNFFLNNIIKFIYYHMSSGKFKNMCKRKKNQFFFQSLD